MAMARKVGLGSLAVALVAAAPLLNTAAAADARGTSPSAVLARADAALGQQYVQLRPRPEPAEGSDKTLAPYFYVDGADPEADRLPLKETTADVQIAGVIARVRIHQVFENSGSKPIEAVYVFPGSTRAAVHGMRMRIGERTIEAKINKKAEARQQYEQAKAQGKRASLLEQQRPNVFTMNVANVMPRDRIEVELDYSELLVPEDAVYEFVFPTVVGPRYGGGADPAKDRWISNPYLTEGKPEPYKFDLKAHLETGIAIKDLISPSHRVTVNYLSPSSADVALQQPGGGNKDFVLRYRLAGDAIESGLLLYQGEKENFFVMMMEPPQRPTLKQIPPREYIFLLDVSGSMSGFPLETTKELMRNLLPQLRPSDYFNIAAFSGASWVLAPGGSLPATSGNIRSAMENIERMQGGGGTELMGGLREAYAIPKPRDEVSRTVVVATDGFVGVEAQAFKFIREHLNEANLFAFGIGTSVNRGLIEGMARAGLGEPFVVLRPELASAEAKKLRDYIEQPVLTNVRVSFSGFDAVEVAPAKLPDLMARRPLVLFGKYRGDARGTVTVRGYSGGGAVVQTLPVEARNVKDANAPLRWLWARKWVELLDDEVAVNPAQEVVDSITDLGLTYGLLTNYTSFVAIDSEIVNRTGSVNTVQQPLPLPEGVSNLAVGGMASAPARVQQSGLLKMLAPQAAPAESYGFADSAGVGTMGSRGSGFGGAGGLGIGGLATAQPSPSQRSKGEVRPAAKESVEELKKAITIAPAKRSIRVKALTLESLDNFALLLEEAEQQLAANANACPAKHGLVKLRLVVDSFGKVVKVEVLSATQVELGKWAAAALRNCASGTRPTAAQGTLTLEVAVR